MNQWTSNYYTKDGHRASRRGPSVPASDPRSLHPAGNHPHHTRHRRPSQTKAGVGGGRNKDKVAYLSVFRVVHLTELTLKSYMEKRGVNVQNVDEISHRGSTYKTFIVQVNERDVEKTLQANFWPGLVSSRRSQEGDHGGRGGVLSRRSAKHSQHNIHTSPSLRVGGEGRVRPTSPRRQVEVHERRRSVTLVAGSPNSKNERERDEKKKSRKVSYPLKKHEQLGPDKRSETKIQHKRSTRERRVPSRKNSLTDRMDKSIKHKAGVNLENSKMNKKGSTKPKNEKHSIVTSVGKRRDTKKPTRTSRSKPKQAWQAPEDKKESATEFSVAKTKSSRNNKVVRKIKNNNINKTEVTKNDFYSDMNQVEPSTVTTATKSPYKRPYTYKSPNRTTKNRNSNEEIDKSVSTTLVENKYPNDSSSNTSKQTHYTSKNGPNTYPNWSMSLKWLLTQSSEEAVSKLLGPDYDRLLGQEDISNEELFLGVSVLAHCTRAKNANPRDLQQLVRKIWQPQIIGLFKTYAVTVEQKFPERAEQYFWNMAEFLDLYVDGGTYIEGINSLISTCLSEVLALNYKRYVGPDLVKVYRGMQTRLK